MSTPEATPGAHEVRLEQRLKPADFLGLSLKNGLLNIVTLTLYRFWGKTEVRRRIWAATYLNGEPLEYTGRGKELFMGFLLALFVITLPLLFVIFGAQFLGPAMAGLIILPVYLGLFFLLGFGIFTAFRYLASRTVWRGVRFGLAGSPVDYGRSYLGYLLLSGVTLGWFWPAAQRRLAGRLWGGLLFGDRPFRFEIAEARKVGVYKPFALAWIGGFVAYIVLFAVLISIGIAQAAEGGEPREPSLTQIVLVYVVAFAILVVGSIIAAPYQTAMLRSIAAGVRLDGVEFHLDLKWPQMAWLSLSNILLITFSLGFLMPFVQARTTKTLMDHLRTTGAIDLSAIRQSADTGPRHGEGLADAFGTAAI
jgi:uncharacterized membrane protein YjgN (DUF898 family)